MNRLTIDEIERAILSTPRPAAAVVDLAEERRRREKFIRFLDEVEAALTSRRRDE